MEINIGNIKSIVTTTDKSKSSYFKTYKVQRKICITTVSGEEISITLSTPSQHTNYDHFGDDKYVQIPIADQRRSLKLNTLKLGNDSLDWILFPAYFNGQRRDEVTK